MGPTLTSWIARRVLLLVGLALLAATTADAQKRRPHPEKAAPAAPTSGDKRDSMVSAPGNAFTGKPYWLALGQCGGVYFRLVTLYDEAAIQTKVVKPDAAASAQFSKKSDEVSKIATAFFVAAEHFLVTDRGLSREDAVMTYDPKAGEAERLKTIDAALQAVKSCPALYQVCHQTFPKACSETLVMAGRHPYTQASSLGWSVAGVPAAHP